MEITRLGTYCNQAHPLSSPVSKFPVPRSLCWRRNSAMESLLSAYFRSSVSLRSEGRVDQKCFSPSILQPAPAPVKSAKWLCLIPLPLGFTLLPSSIVLTGDPQLSPPLACSTSSSTFIHSASPLPPTEERLEDSRKIERLELLYPDWSISPLKHRQQVFYRGLRRVAAFRFPPPVGLPGVERGAISVSFRI